MRQSEKAKEKEKRTKGWKKKDRLTDRRERGVEDIIPKHLIIIDLLACRVPNQAPMEPQPGKGDHVQPQTEARNRCRRSDAIGGAADLRG